MLENYNVITTIQPDSTATILGAVRVAAIAGFQPIICGRLPKENHYFQLVVDILYLKETDAGGWVDPGSGKTYIVDQAGRDFEKTVKMHDSRPAGKNKFLQEVNGKDIAWRNRK